MSEFTSKDRERSQKTLTLLEAHIKLSDERHVEIKKLIDDHEARIRNTETTAIKNAVIACFTGSGITAALVMVVRSLWG